MRAVLDLTLTSAVCVVLALASACIAPPIIAPAGKPTLELTAAQRAMNAEPIEVDVGNGEKLRGIFVPGLPDRPLVLHFLGWQMSITSGDEVAGIADDFDPLFAGFARSGWASLVLDYRGVGASDGTRDPRHLPDDALAAWNEALRRAGGDRSNVIVRGVSIGTLAAASLLQRGIDPGAVVLIAPVLAETIAEQRVAEFDNSFEAAAVTPSVRRPVEMDMLAAIGVCPAPLLVVLAARDPLLPLSQRESIASAVAGRGSLVIECVVRDLDHSDLVRASCSSLFGGVMPACAGSPMRFDEVEYDDFLDDSRMCQVPPGRAFR